MAVTVPEMLKMSQTQLDDLFTQISVGEIPGGEARGTAIVAPGTTYTQDMRISSIICVAGESF